MTQGTYLLILSLSESAVRQVGSLDEVLFHAGWYVYVGSAFGPGGFSRITRHRELANSPGSQQNLHWHIDYLLTLPSLSFCNALTWPNIDRECSIAKLLHQKPVAGFGSSDCNCHSHLGYFSSTSCLRSWISTIDK